jgi:hypothetical protein
MINVMGQHTDQLSLASFLISINGVRIIFPELTLLQHELMRRDRGVAEIQLRDCGLSGRSERQNDPEVNKKNSRG